MSDATRPDENAPHLASDPDPEPGTTVEPDAAPGVGEPTSDPDPEPGN